jgi:hypothetical protein
MLWWQTHIFIKVETEPALKQKLQTISGPFPYARDQCGIKRLHGASSRQTQGPKSLLLERVQQSLLKLVNHSLHELLWIAPAHDRDRIRDLEHDELPLTSTPPG